MSLFSGLMPSQKQKSKSKSAPPTYPHGYAALDGSAVSYPLAASKSAMCSAWEGERVMDSGVGIGSSIGRVEAELSKAQDDPMDRPHQFEKARHHWKKQWFIREITRMRYNFYHYGFTVRGDGGTNPPNIAKWEKNNRKMYRRYAREAWLEWLILDNVVGLWWRKGIHPPVVYPPERTKFKDLFGHETIEIRHGVTQEDITTIGAFSRSQAKQFETPEIKIDHDNQVFGFDILRRERTGCGFGIPTIAPLFVCAAQMTSLEVGDAQLAAACRLVLEVHLKGHEIKAGLHAGSKANFWTAAWAKAMEKAITGRTGHVRTSQNFDYSVVQAANWPDPKVYDEKRYASPLHRMALWSMPLGQMLDSGGQNPFLLLMLQQQARAEREYMAEHLKTVFIEAFGAPEDIEPMWGDECFTDPRVLADLLKTGLAAGPVSQRTFLESIGRNQEEEWERKQIEGAKGKKLTTPIYDAAHGPDDGKSKAGRKPGTKDGDGE